MTSIDGVATVVVCHGDDDTLATVCENLIADRFEALPAPSGADALRLCRFSQPDILILDLSLPDMPGIDVLQEIREADGIESRIDPNVAIIVLLNREDGGRSLSRSRELAFEQPTEAAVVADRADVAAVIARNVRDARTRRHLRQRDLGLADTAGAGLIESGMRQPELHGLLTIARALEVPTEFLLRGMSWEPPEHAPAATAGRRGRRHDFHVNDEAAARLWRDDLTASEIAAEIGITQPSVEGIVRRLRARGVYLPSRAAGRRAARAVPVEHPSGSEAHPAHTEDVERLHGRLAANLKQHRLAAGLSLGQLAEAAELREGSIWRAETRDHELRLLTAVRLAGARVPLAWIARGIAWEPQARTLALEGGEGTDSAPGFGARLGANIRRYRRRSASPRRRSRPGPESTAGTSAR